MRRSEIIRYCLFAFLAFILTSLSYRANLFYGIENSLEDTLYTNKPITPEIVIIAIDDPSLNTLGQWPWPRATLAQIIKNLEVYKPRALGVDILLTEPSRVSVDDDLKLKAALHDASFPIILSTLGDHLEISAEKAHTIKLLQPYATLISPKTKLGAVNVISDKDGMVRRFPTSITSADGITVPSLALSVLKYAGFQQKTEQPYAVERIVYAGLPHSIRTVSAYDIFNGKEVANLQQRIFFIGATAESLHDSSKTPLSLGENMPGVEIHGHIANMYLNNYRLIPMTAQSSYLLFFILTIITLLIFIISRKFIVAIITNILLGFTYLIAIVILFSHGIAANVVHVTLAWLLSTVVLSLYRFFSSERKQQQMRGMFGKYVSPNILQELLNDPDKVTLGGEERLITVLFADIRDFTSMSERLSPTELVRVLNQYFSAVTSAITDNDGVLDKYIGDAIMAFWGAPLPDKLQADRALIAAKAMLAELNKLNAILAANGDPQIRIGIGIYTGKAVVGNVGSEHRYDYTAIGDSVNAASRIEGLTKQFNASIIIGDTTKELLRGNHQVTPLGETLVKGKAKPITIFRVDA